MRQWRRRSAAGRQHWRGFALFELAICVAIMAIVASVLLQRLQFYQEQVERVAMEQVVVALRSALHAKLASLYISNGETSSLVDQNPMDWLSRKPKNYLGEFYSPGPQEVAGDTWYFDRSGKNLVHLLTKGNLFQSNESKRVIFKVELNHLNLPQDKSLKAGGRHDGVVLVQVNG